jgi:methyl-accepting chemotaxis protein
VVAGEVKDLAQETAKATEDIAGRVDAIQADTAEAVRAIERIAEIVGKINEYQTVIAAAGMSGELQALCARFRLS